jgi:hypothetical protein
LTLSWLILQSVFQRYLAGLSTVMWPSKDTLEVLVFDFFEYFSLREFDPSNTLAGTCVPPRALSHLIPFDAFLPHTPSYDSLRSLHNSFSSLSLSADDVTQAKVTIATFDLTSIIMRWDALRFCPDRIAKEIQWVVADMKRQRVSHGREIVAVRTSSLPDPERFSSFSPLSFLSFSFL